MAPDQRLPWGKTVGLGAQHVVAMFGATFVFPIVMGLNANLAIMISGICTILLPADRPEQGAELPRHLGFLRRRRRAIRARQAADSADVTGAILVAGWCCSRSAGRPLRAAPASSQVLPPAVTGAVVMLIGFNLAPVVTSIYWPQDQWVAILTMTVHGLTAVVLPGFWRGSRSSSALIFGYLLSWVFDGIFGQITSVLRSSTEATATTGSTGPG